MSFIGTVRDFSEVKGENGLTTHVPVQYLQYECYKDMAMAKMEEIRDQAMNSYEIDNMLIIHRMGKLDPSDRIVMIAVSAAHRKDAFGACQYAIDELKRSVPIWKKEFTPLGECWVGADD